MNRPLIVDVILFELARSLTPGRIAVWSILVAFPVGFFLMGVEFLRFLFTKEPMHTGLAGLANERAELEMHKKSFSEES